MRLSNISIGARLKTGFAIVLLLTVTLALVAWVQIQKIGDIVTEINDSWMVSVTQLNDMKGALADMRGKLRGTIAVIQESADQVGTASAQIATGNTDLSERTEKQASNLQETAASIEQLSATVVQGAQSAQQATQLAAAAAQTAGFRQISGAVTELDRSTPQNAALVAESAAAAMSLRDQAESLSTAVSQFRLRAN